MPPEGSPTAPMRIALHDFGAYPFSAQLGRTLADRGHTVDYLYASGFKTPRARLDADAHGRFTASAIGVGEAYRPGAGLRRLRQERRYGQALADRIRTERPEVVISANCPLDAQLMALRAADEVGAGFVCWMQDVYSDAVRRLLARRLPLAAWLIGRRFESLDRRIALDADAVVVISEGFRDPLRRWGVPDERVHVISNWAPLDEIEPMPRDNPWARRHGLVDTPTLLYAGTLGRKHDPTMLAALADGVPEATVVVVADGVGVDALRAVRPFPPNLRILPLQETSEVPAMLGAADVLLALLEPDAGEFSIPSKVLTYLAAGRPVLAAMPPDNDATRFLQFTGAGVVVDARDREGFVATARRLIADRELRRRVGGLALAHARLRFEVEAKADAFETVLTDVVLRSHSPTAASADTSGMTSDHAPTGRPR